MLSGWHCGQTTVVSAGSRLDGTAAPCGWYHRPFGQRSLFRTDGGAPPGLTGTGEAGSPRGLAGLGRGRRPGLVRATGPPGAASMRVVRLAERTWPSRTRPARSAGDGEAELGQDRVPGQGQRGERAGQDHPRAPMAGPACRSATAAACRGGMPSRPARAAARSSRCCSRCPVPPRTGTCTPAAGTPALVGRGGLEHQHAGAQGRAEPEPDRGHQVPRRHDAAQQQPEDEQDDDRRGREHDRIVVIDRALDIGETDVVPTTSRTCPQARPYGRLPPACPSSDSPRPWTRVTRPASPYSRWSPGPRSAGAATSRRRAGS